MRWRSAFLLVVAIGLAATADAQFRRGLFGVRLARPADFDGRFHFCRLVYDPSPTGTGGSWRTDFPRADINMSIRLSELTRTDVSFTATQPNPLLVRPIDDALFQCPFVLMSAPGTATQPNPLLVRPIDDALFQCPFVLMSAPGSAGFSDKDAERLRQFVLKGGFLWADDFWGSYQWEQWLMQIRKVLPASEYRIVDLPLSHPMLTTQFVVREVPQIPNIGYFMRSGGDTSEQGADSAIPHARIISDATGRAMVLMTHNTDIGDSWEREGDDPRFFYRFGVPGYAFGINAILYSLTH